MCVLTYACKCILYVCVHVYASVTVHVCLCMHVFASASMYMFVCVCVCERRKRDTQSGKDSNTLSSAEVGVEQRLQGGREMAENDRVKCNEKVKLKCALK